MFSFRSVAIAALLALLCAPSYADSADERGDFRFKFGGWSKHFHKEEHVFRDYELNENHEGLGFQYWHDLRDTQWDIGMDFFTMLDSYYKRSHMLSIAGRYPFELNNDILTEISIQVGATYHNRNSMFTRSYITKEDGVVTDIRSIHTIYRNEIITPMLTTTFTFKDKLDVDFILLPKNEYTNAGVAFVRLGWNW